MVTEPVSFSYHPSGAMAHNGSLPFLPIELRYAANQFTVNALLDSGASVNVLPYSLGVQHRTIHATITSI
jgi:hypothetical protein